MYEACKLLRELVWGVLRVLPIVYCVPMVELGYAVVRELPHVSSLFVVYVRCALPLIAHGAVYGSIPGTPPFTPATPLHPLRSLRCYTFLAW